jgi:hypothetical protein
MDDRTKNSVRQLVGRAVARFRRDTGHHDAAVGVIFDDTERSVLVMTVAARGDNVSWATSLSAHACGPLIDRGWKIVNRLHCCGNVNVELVSP